MHWGDAVVTILKFIHVVFAAAWVGGALYSQLLVVPVLRESTPGTRREFAGRMLPRSLKLVNAMGGLAILSGVALVYAMRDSFALADMWGRLMTFGLVGSIAVLYLVNYSLRPAMRAMEKLQAESSPGTPPPPGLGLLQKKMAITGGLNLLILLVVLAVMVAANQYYG